MKYYSTDRRGFFTDGAQFALAMNADPGGNEIVAHINERYPDGFSLHGIQYFRDPLNNQTQKSWQSGILELLCEATRKAYYPDKPSRYQSMFACDSLEAAIQFRAQYGHPENPIHEVIPAAGVHRGDMTLLNICGTFASVDHKMHLYWQGKTLQNEDHKPAWESVLALPVRIGAKVA